MDKLDNLLMEAGQLANDDNLVGALQLLIDAPAELQTLGRYQFAKGTLFFKTRKLDAAVQILESNIE